LNLQSLLAAKALVERAGSIKAEKEALRTLKELQ
jgi:hypothetical protein